MRRQSSVLLSSWDVVIVIAATAAALLAPAHVIGSRDLVPGFEVFDAAWTVLFLTDFFIRLRFQREQTGKRRWWLLACDLVSSLPIYLIGGLASLSLLRLAKLPRLISLMGSWRHHHLERWNILRLVFFRSFGGVGGCRSL